MLKKTDKFSLPETEEDVLRFWKENGVFGKALKKKPSQGTFVFYEGPPTANGRPGIHHVLARSFKDVVLRYKTMRGYRVPRKGGWDTHGLPVELEVEKALGLKSKKEIESYGVSAFNKKCKESVWTYKDEWERLTERMGFWLDMDDPYVTYENAYMESVWNVFAEVEKKGLLYKGHKIVPWCTRCGTGLSSHEVAQGYKEVEDESAYVRFKVPKGEKVGPFISDGKFSILSWTTTPWTLPGNVALAVGADIDYAVVSVGEGKKQETFVLAAPRLSALGVPYETLGTVKGKELAGVRYEPLFPFEAFTAGSAKDVSYRVYTAGFVTTGDGTGVVHIAPMYGQDDHDLGRKHGLPQVHTVDEHGRFVPEVAEFAGLYAKGKETGEKVVATLAAKGALVRTETYAHEYPFCWRCGTALLYYARHSWFVEMSKLRGALMKENAKINWVPASVKTGRFGEWIKDAKDWAISRERYWGTPLPIWECGSCKTAKVVGSVAELEKTQPKPRNRYILLRHGESENNVRSIVNCHPETEKWPLTAKGRAQAEKAAKKLAKEKIDLIFASDILRAKETAQFAKEATGAPLIFDERLREWNMGALNGKTVAELQASFSAPMEKFTKALPDGETFAGLRARVWDFIRETEEKYEGKTILLVSHEDPLWLLASAMECDTDEESLARKEGKLGAFLNNGETLEPAFRKLPRDETGKFDLHKPYIDAVAFPCGKCGGDMRRIPEVADVWFDSGAMPFAQAHWPMERSKHLDFPADYIAEGMDQTRGWFYTLLAISTLLGRGAPYKNVVSLGLVLDKNGQKMSKSKGNVVNPWDVMKNHGIDAARWHFYTVNAPGEAKKFDELELQKISRQFFALMYNSFLFFDMYGDRKTAGKTAPKPEGALDKWIMARLAETSAAATASMDAYDIGGAARAVEEFAGDLSRWYIRRSRRRLQRPESKADYAAASAVCGHALRELSKLIAPFAPFFAEALHQSLGAKGKQSVHLEDWPATDKKAIDRKLIEGMAAVRAAASAALAKRAELGVKVRQPLASLTLKSAALKGKRELLAILMDEVNVKKVAFDPSMEEDMRLDTHVTEELRREGLARELVRTAQDLRQDAGLSPKDAIVLHVDAPAELHAALVPSAAAIAKDVRAKRIEWKRSSGCAAEIETKLGDQTAWVAVQKTK